MIKIKATKRQGNPSALGRDIGRIFSETVFHAGSLYIPDFGKVKLRYRKQIRRVLNGIEIITPPKWVIDFNPSEFLIQKINKKI